MTRVLGLLFVLSVACLVANESVFAIPVAPGAPVSGYLFNEGTGGSTNPDSTADSFGANPAVLENFEDPNDWSTDVPFPSAGNHSINLQSANSDFLNIGDPNDLPLSHLLPYSVSAWYKFDLSVPVEFQEGTIISKGGGPSGNRQFQLFASAVGVNNSHSIRAIITGTLFELPFEALDPNVDLTAWHHIAVTNTPDPIDPSFGTIKMYFDGVEGLSEVNGLTFNTQPNADVLIGARRGTLFGAIDNTTTAFHVTGNIDEIAVYNSVLTPENIEYLAQNSLSTLITGVGADFDTDGDVDGNDFLLWQRGGSPNPFSSTDLTAWETQYGTISPISSAVAAVPEPTTLAMAVSLLIALGCRNPIGKRGSR